MSHPRFDQLPDALKKIDLKPLFVMRLEVKKPMIMGQTPDSFRRIGVVVGGRFDGELLSGKVLEGGSDWQTVRADSAITLDVKLVLQTDDGEIFSMIYTGIRSGTAEIIQKIEKGETVDPADYYFRISPRFETASVKYNWLNRILAVGTGHREASGPVYSIFEVQ